MVFFSSRRRHTRYIGHWSSDVCSSDLYFLPPCWSAHPRGRRGSFPSRRMKRRSSSTTIRSRSEERRVGKECRSRGSARQSQQTECGKLNDEASGNIRRSDRHGTIVVLM